jgi:hypothetical protein
MLRTHSVQRCFILADSACGEALYDSTSLRRILGIVISVLRGASCIAVAYAFENGAPNVAIGFGQRPSDCFRAQIRHPTVGLTRTSNDASWPQVACRVRPQATHSGQLTFSEPVSQLKAVFANRSAHKRPLATSPNRPQPAGRLRAVNR